MVDNQRKLSFRKARADDVVPIAQMLRRFYHKSGGVYGIPYDHCSCLAIVIEVLERGICLVGDESCAGAILAPFPYNRNAIIAEVLFWYFEASKEIAIFDALIKACREAGASHINAAALAPKMTGRRFYGVRHLSHAESHFLGPLKIQLQKPAEEVKAAS